MPAMISPQPGPLLRQLIGLVCLSFLIVPAALASSADPPRTARNGSKALQVTHVCIITAKFQQLADFYRQVLQLEPKRFQDDYLEFQTPGAIISLYQQDSFHKIAPKAAFQTGTGGLMLELQVADADQEYTRLQGLNLGINFILPPTTFPWGNRSIYLKDPDGNLLNLYSLVPTP